MLYTLTCPECKNKLDLSERHDLKSEDIIECNHCGITLQITSIAPEGNLTVEIVEEGK